MKLYSSLLIKEFILTVSLGWSDEERHQPQTIHTNIELQFPRPPMACQSDELSETVCYDRLTQAIQAHIAHKSFRLVEYLAGELYLVIKNEVQHIFKDVLSHEILVNIEVCKQPNTKEAIQGGICFRYGDRA